MILSYKYRLKGRRSARSLRRCARAVNQVWNYCVQTQRTVQRRWRDGAVTSWLSGYDLCALTTGTSRDLGICAQSIQSTCAQFVRSRDQHHKCPRFRSSSGPKRALGWIPFPYQARQLGIDSIGYFGKSYRLFGAKRRPLPVVVKGGAFVEDARGLWYVVLYVEVSDLAPAPDFAVGIDLGIKTTATLSDGEKIDNPCVTATWAQRLAVAQRAGNRARVRAIHAKIKNVRADHLHKASALIAARYRTIFVGNVSSSQLARTRMAKSVGDAGWSTLRNHLRYKASRHGGVFLEVDEKFTTQTCSMCGALPPGRPRGIAGLGIREWECSACGSRHDRDVNAARNILAIGLGAQPRDDGSRAPIGVDRLVQVGA